MTFDIHTTDWTEARKRLDGRKTNQQAKDIFEGEAKYCLAFVEGVKTMRVSVRPRTGGRLANLLQSYAVCGDAEWKNVPAGQITLPCALTWKQSRAGRFDFAFEMPSKMSAHGLGERFSEFNLRGSKHTLFATDNPHHNEHTDMLYKAIPFLILAEGTKCTGLFLDSPAPQRWDLDSELGGRGAIELFTRRGFSLYIFEAESLPALVQAFTGLTGRAPLPPLWSLGHQQSRWSYPDQNTIRELASQFRRRKIPCDTLVLDIDYMDEYRIFTYSRERFPSFPTLAGELAEDNFKLIAIVDPGVKKDEKYQVYRQGKSGDFFCKTARGQIFFETVWPGLSAFPDFLKKETRKWWQENLKFFVDNGIAGIWNDMNEPAMFNNQKPLPEPLDELPEEKNQLFVQEGEDGPIGHFEVRNLYGFLMSLATHQALTQYRPGERPFVLTRSASTGIQRYAAVWLGDNISWFEHLQKSLPMLLNIGLSGVPFAGVDVGGFGGHTTPELLVRWYEMGIFYPFFRNHCAMLGRAQEPFSFNETVEKMARHLIEMRYRLLPYIQGLFWEHLRTGAPLMRPMAWHYSDDQLAVASQDQFMFGPQIMVAPVVRPNQDSRYVYFPPGNWYPLDSDRPGETLAGGSLRRVSCPLGRVPAFVREGAVIPLADIMQSTAEYASSAITFHAYGKEAAGRYFEDDGHTLQYQEGCYNEWIVEVKKGRFSSRPVHQGLPATAHNYLFTCGGETEPVLLV